MTVSIPRSSDSDLEQEEGNWQDWEEGDEEEECEAAQSLFEQQTFPSVAAACAYDKQEHGFDFLAFRRQHALDTYGTIKAVNWIRTQSPEDWAVASQLPPFSQPGGTQPWGDDKYLQPVLENDAYLFFDYEEAEAAPNRNVEANKVKPAATPLEPQGAIVPNGALQSSSTRMRELEAEVAALREALQASCPELAGLDKASSSQPAPAPGGYLHLQGASTSSAGGPEQTEKGKSAAADPSGDVERPTGGGEPASRDTEKREKLDRNYFSSYGHLDIHYTMLRDKVRTLAYQEAIEGNPSLFKGATVLDVGCGTGILSMFAARAGAKRVIAVEGSAEMARVAEDITRHNKLDKASGGPIEVVQGRLEDLEPCQVDVVVSEWMGYALLFEGMLSSVLYARDRWLKPGGGLLPDKATLYLAAASSGATERDMWQDVYGFSYSPVWEHRKQDAVRTALVEVCPRQHIISMPAPVHTLDLLKMSEADQDFSAAFSLRGSGECHAVVLWFDTPFSAAVCPEKQVNLSTSPLGIPTHWAQTILTLKEPVRFTARPPSPPGASLPGDSIPGGAVCNRVETGGKVTEDGGKEPAGSARGAASQQEVGKPQGVEEPEEEGLLTGRLSMARSDTKRGIEISLEVQDGRGGTQVMVYRMVMSG